MKQRILIIQGNPDASTHRLDHALAAAYSAGALEQGHEVRLVEVATLDFPLLRSENEWDHGAVPDSIGKAQDAIHWASHLLIVYPLWLGTMPALLKGFLEQVFRPGFALASKPGRWERLLRGRSAHVVVTMGMPAWVYRCFFLAHGVRSLTRGVLRMTGISPVRTTLLGGVKTAGDAQRVRWLERMRHDGRTAK